MNVNVINEEVTEVQVLHNHCHLLSLSLTVRHRFMWHHAQYSTTCIASYALQNSPASYTSNTPSYSPSLLSW